MTAPLHPDSLVLLSIRPEFAALIRNGSKRVEFRKRFNPILISCPIIIYETAPCMQFSLWVTLKDIVCDSPANLWNQFGRLNGTHRKPYNEYFDGKALGHALIIDRVQSFKKPVSLNEIRSIREGYRPPQSYSIIKKDNPLYKFFKTRARNNPEEIPCPSEF